jgi:hypothetical protein
LLPDVKTIGVDIGIGIAIAIEIGFSAQHRALKADNR